MGYDFSLVAVSILAGAVASVAGFGIGSLLTPLLALTLGTKLAVAVISIPHLLATALRFFLLRSHLDKRIFFTFGLMSMAGSFSGALLHSVFHTPALTFLFGLILVFAGFTGATGISERIRFRGPYVWAAGLGSGFLGGLVGNQGGIRSAALLSAKIPKNSFLATATGIGLAVDMARMPVYLWSEHERILAHGYWITLTSLGAVGGTLLGMKALQRIPERAFKRTVSAFIFLLGGYMVYRGL